VISRNFIHVAVLALPPLSTMSVAALSTTGNRPTRVVSRDTVLAGTAAASPAQPARVALRLRQNGGKRHARDRTAAVAGEERNCASLQCEQAPDDRQSQPGAALLGRVEGLE